VHRPSPLAALLAALVLLLTSCGGGDETSSAGDHNAADVEFATGMIPHHAQALHMVEMAEDRGRSPEFRRLLDDIEEAQGPEIEQMAGWLEDWDEEVPPTEMPMGPGGGHGMDHDTGPETGMHPGMMGPREFDRLDQMPRGEAFERMWIRMMIEHHEGAIEMSETEVADGEYPDAIRLAEDIIEAQRAEIELMEELLRR
jgi:uncharacterized protein (DUF305 family)